MDIHQILSGDKNSISQIVDIISVLSDCPLDILYQANLDDLNKIDISWINNKVEKDIQKIIEIDGIKYGAVKDMKELSLGEYIDLDSYSNKMNDNLHRVTAILMRPILKQEGELYIIEKYDNKNVEDRANLFMNKMNVAQLISLTDFFVDGASGFLKNMKISL
jgi:hypothetical protein